MRNPFTQTPRAFPSTSIKPIQPTQPTRCTLSARFSFEATPPLALALLSMTSVQVGAALAKSLFHSVGPAGAFQARWDAVQTAFVDDPRRVVEQADSLVAELMQQLAETFAQERTRFEQQWDQSGDVSTEDLRLALQRYRSFFQRLLST